MNHNSVKTVDLEFGATFKCKAQIEFLSNGRLSVTVGLFPCLPVSIN